MQMLEDFAKEDPEGRSIEINPKEFKAKFIGTAITEPVEEGDEPKKSKVEMSAKILRVLPKNDAEDVPEKFVIEFRNKKGEIWEFMDVFTSIKEYYGELEDATYDN
jgi:hypothetical protein